MTAIPPATVNNARITGPAFPVTRLPPAPQRCQYWHYHDRANLGLDGYFSPRRRHRRHRRRRPGRPARPLADGGRPPLPAARHADRPAGRHGRTVRGAAAATRTRPGRRPVREQEHRGRRLSGAARRGHGGEPPGGRHPDRPASHHPGRGAPGQRLLRRPARELGARRRPQPGRGGLRTAGGGDASRTGLRPGRDRTGDRYQRLFPARAARLAPRYRQPLDAPPRAARRPGRGHRHDRRPAGPGPAHPV